MRKAVLMMILAVVSSSAMAEWVKVSVNEDFISYANPATILKNGNMVKMWCLYDFNAPQRMGDNRPYLSVKEQNEFDCKEEKMRTLSSSSHSGAMGGGIVIRANSEPGKEKPFLPGSAGEVLYKFACGKQ